jgi:hypothetical protein
MMKLFGVISTAVLFVLFGIAVPLYAQQPDEDKNRQEEAKPAQQQEEEKKRDEAKPAPQQEEKRDQAKPAQQQGEKQSKKAQRAGGGSKGHIPDDRFRANFGRAHTFRINHVTTVSSTPQFVYGGYTFIIVDPWPAVWLYTDDCYIDFIDDEYFLFDLAHPGKRILVNVVVL